VRCGSLKGQKAAGAEMKKKKKKLDKGKEARRLARTAAAVPAGTRVIVDKRKKAEKHRGVWMGEEP